MITPNWVSGNNSFQPEKPLKDNQHYHILDKNIEDREVWEVKESFYWAN